MRRFLANKLVVVLAAGLVVLSCSSEPSSLAHSAECEESAVRQAAAEERWGQLLEEHVRADRVLDADPKSETARAAHDDSAALLVGARVDVILAEARTRNNCG